MVRCTYWFILLTKRHKFNKHDWFFSTMNIEVAKGSLGKKSKSFFFSLFHNRLWFNSSTASLNPSQSCLMRVLTIGASVCYVGTQPFEIALNVKKSTFIFLPCRPSTSGPRGDWLSLWALWLIANAKHDVPGGWVTTEHTLALGC